MANYIPGIGSAYFRHDRLYNPSYADDNYVCICVRRNLKKTIILLIFASNTTHLTNYCSIKKAWPLYLTIGKLPASICGFSNSLSIVTIVLLLAVPAKKYDTI